MCSVRRHRESRPLAWSAQTCSANFVCRIPAEPCPAEGKTAESSGVRKSAGHPLNGVQGRQKEGVHNVHTLGFGFGCTGVGLVRIGDVFGGVAGFQGLAPGSSPTSGTVFPQVQSFLRCLLLTNLDALDLSV
jgi:hypothetical protein